MQEPEHSEWSGRTDGTPFMQKALIVLFKVVPLEVIYVVMALVVPFYMLFNHKGYMAMYHFFSQRLGKKPLSAFWHVYRNHYAFGQVVLDRFATYAGRRFKLEIDGNEHFMRLCEGEKGFVMLSSHVGNYEQAGYMLRSDRKSFNALVYAGESATVMNERSKQFSDSNIHMIPVQADMSHLFLINKTSTMATSSACLPTAASVHRRVWDARSSVPQHSSRWDLSPQPCRKRCQHWR